MFTGLVQDVGRIAAVSRRGRSARLAVESPLAGAGDLVLGESIAVDGVCLTVAATSPGRFELDLSPETLDRTTLVGLRVGHGVHLERALRLTDRLGGHWVLGHVDGVGTLRERRPEGSAAHLTFSAPPAVSRYLAPKGCVAVDGVSLTVNHCTPDGFSVTIVPHTAERTKLGAIAVGAAVNLEADIIGKYVAGLLAARLGEARDEPLAELLAGAGFGPAADPDRAP